MGMIDVGVLLFGVLYIGGILAVIGFALVLLHRIAKALERIAGAQERAAQSGPVRPLSAPPLAGQ